MAAADRARQFIGLLNPVSGSGSPVGSVTPSMPGVQYTDTNTSHLWLATGLSDSDWLDLSAGGGGAAQTLAVYVAGGTNQAARNELSWIVETPAEIDMPTAPQDGDLQTVVNANAGTSEVSSESSPGTFWTSQGAVSTLTLGQDQSYTFRWDDGDGLWIQVINALPIVDSGLVTVQSWDGTAAVKFGQFEVMPAFTADQGAMRSQAPPDGQALKPLQTITAGGLIQALISQTLTAGIWDDVDVRGELLVYDLTGENLLSASFFVTVNPSSGFAPAALSEVHLEGGDLSISEDTLSIVSAAGATYNVLVTATASWD